MSKYNCTDFLKSCTLTDVGEGGLNTRILGSIYVKGCRFQCDVIVYPTPTWKELIEAWF